MRILFVHRGFPGQYLHLAMHLAAQGHDVVAMRDAANPETPLPGVRQLAYDPPPTVPLGLMVEEAQLLERTRRAGNVAIRFTGLLKSGFRPDLIYAHVGFGEALYLKDLEPRSKLVVYCDFLEQPLGTAAGYDQEFYSQKPPILWQRVNHGPALACLTLSDAGVAPTRWQRQLFPAAYASHIRVIHDGIDTDVATPGQSDEELITYVARSLEPHRGFHIFMRAIPEIQLRRPNARIVIVGGDEVSYSNYLPHGETYRNRMLHELDGKIDLSRVSFLGRIPYHEYLALLRRSSVHVYLTYPFVLSWSLLEAMASGCLVIGSRTPPVEEVIEDGVNGLLVDFFSPGQLAARIDDALQRRRELAPLREAARRTVVERYDLKRACLPAQVQLINEITTTS